ncbi:MAG: EF-hand domain-containing protein [Desulfobacterales bacterium]
MKKISVFLSLMMVAAFAAIVYAEECPPGKEKTDSYHKGMGTGAGLSGYRVHFKEIDKDGDGTLNWEEYSAHFPNTEKKVFDALDTGKDGSISQEEWHNFKAAHGMAGPHPGHEGKKYHQANLPDPAPYNAHFPDMDKNSDDAISMEEFKAFFPKGEETVFNAIDLDKNSSLSHEEWHEFRTAHGMGHKDK